jgi:GDP-L-fucose synthase
MKANRALIEKKPFVVWGDGTAERDFLHFDDAAKAILRCMEIGITPELVNISSGKSTTIRMLCELVCKSAGVTDIEFQIDKPVGIQSRLVDNTVLRSLGFNQLIKLDFGIQRLYRWHSENILDVRE